jgi:hypothetical protein
LEPVIVAQVATDMNPLSNIVHIHLAHAGNLNLDVVLLEPDFGPRLDRLYTVVFVDEHSDLI